MGSTVCAQSGLEVEFEDDPLFKDANVLPGYSVVRWVKVTNTSGDIQPIATEAIEFSPIEDSPYFGSDPGDVPSDDLSRALTITISIQGGDDLYGGSTGEKTLFQFYQDGETYLSAVDNGVTEEYVFEIAFPANKGNEWQGKTTNFKISAGFMGKEGGPTCNYDGVQNNGETGIDCGGGGCPTCGSGGGGGGPVPPGLRITNEATACVGTTDAIINWLTTYKSTSRVIYDTEFGQFDMSETTNYGYAFSTIEKDNIIPISQNGVTAHTVELIGLTPNTTYYFRCVSHASPPSIGEWREFTTLAVGEGDPCCEYPPEDEPPVEPPVEEPPAEEPEGGMAHSGPTDTGTGGITGGTPPDEEEPPAEEEPSKEEPTEDEPEANFTAGLGGIFSDLFKGWSDGFPCLPWWLLLILIIYSLVKGKKAWKRRDQEAIESMRAYWKKAAIVWFDWGFLLLALLLIFYFFLHICFTLLIFLILALLTALIQYSLSRAYRKRRDNL